MKLNYLNTTFYLTQCFLLYLLGLSACTQRSSDEVQISDRPNIVIIFADDMGYGDAGCYNPDSKIPTPHIDRIAQNGVRFTDAHAPGAWCVPSRYGLMTGQYPARTTLNWQERSLIEVGTPTLASLLQENGYYTSMIGKWHLGFDNVDWQNVNGEQRMEGGPVDRGFDEFFGMHASLDIPPYFYIENDRPVAPPSDSIGDHQSENATTTISGAFWRAGKIAPGFKHEEVLPTFTEKAVTFLNEHQQNSADTPFLLYLALTAPHTPWLPAAEFEGKSKAGEYGDFMAQVDHTVGQVVQTLETLELIDNTIVIFASDNGPVWFAEDEQKFDHEATGLLRGMKVDLWEGGHRIPFVAQWPGKIPSGTVRDDLFCFTDLMATFAAVVGDTLPENAGEDSYNMLPVLMNKSLSQSIRNELLIQDRVMRVGEWKLIQGSGLGTLSERFGNVQAEPDADGELYNLSDDLSEQHNRYEEFPEKVKELSGKLEKFAAVKSASPLP